MQFVLQDEILLDPFTTISKITFNFNIMVNIFKTKKKKISANAPNTLLVLLELSLLFTLLHGYK